MLQIRIPEIIGSILRMLIRHLKKRKNDKSEQEIKMNILL